MNIDRALACNGWMSEEELRFLAETAEKSNRIVEIGSWAGRSACAFGVNTPGVVFCVDVWERNLVHDETATPEGNLDVSLFNEFRKNLAGLPVIPVVLDSLTAAERFRIAGEKFDLIFIDGDHREAAVRMDLYAWRPLLAEGGIFCGHDYGFDNWPDVKAVVDEVVGPVSVIGTIWVAK